ncbi:MAG TPA: PQQ-binding-like beta-propeller repeat protein [Bryobacteraceae bacterium]|jgi:polyvinyl alcohol dehydrogenase (cytochrome)|nr:PQQ-binding-like beta-propeller repeat protein [Bryobacteraceae bacterium]
MRYVCLIVLTIVLTMPGLLSAQEPAASDGAAIYKERCMKCHDMPAARVPSLTTIKGMTGEAIYLALTSGVMKSQTEGLSTVQIFSLIGYIAPTGGKQATAPSFTATCKGDGAPQANAVSPATVSPSSNAAQWNGWSPGVTNSRFQDAKAAGLTAGNVPKLKLKWAFNLGDVTLARSQPTIAGGRVYLTSQTGAVYALDANTGCMHWGFQAAPGLRSGVTFGEANGAPAVFLVDGGATLYALNAQTGALIWKNKPVDHFSTLGTATPRYYKGMVYEGFSSFEEALAGDPKYHCCTFRGSVVALDSATGKKIWQTFTIPEPAKPDDKTPAGAPDSGPSGAGVWSSPTIDEQLGVLYVATGDNYSDPPTDTSDAVLAMDLKTGKLLWSKQLTMDDAFNNSCGTPQLTNCPKERGPDFDFGQPPILVRLGRGKRALVIAQKSGMAHAVDPDQKGKILWQTRAGEGGPLGGSQWGSASDGRNVYVAISNPGIGVVADPKLPAGYRMTLDPMKGGGLSAIDLRTGKIVWSAKPIPCAAGRSDCSPEQSAAVTVIPGAVFSGSVDGHLRAYSTKTGAILWDTDTEREFPTVNGKPAHGGAMDAAGPAVVNGMVFVNSGYGQWGGMAGNAFLVYSVDGK